MSLLELTARMHDIIKSKLIKLNLFEAQIMKETKQMKNKK